MQNVVFSFLEDLPVTTFSATGGHLWQANRTNRVIFECSWVAITRIYIIAHALGA